MRFYGFSAEEIVDENCNLPTEYDPKCAWALRNMGYFPVEVNTAPPEVLVRVPGIGFKGANKIVMARRFGKLSYDDLQKMRIVLKRAVHFITINGKFYGREKINAIERELAIVDDVEKYEQISLFSHPEVNKSVLLGEI